MPSKRDRRKREEDIPDVTYVPHLTTPWPSSPADSQADLSTNRTYLCKLDRAKAERDLSHLSKRINDTTIERANLTTLTSNLTEAAGAARAKLRRLKDIFERWEANYVEQRSALRTRKSIQSLGRQALEAVGSLLGLFYARRTSVETGERAIDNVNLTQRFVSAYPDAPDPGWHSGGFLIYQHDKAQSLADLLSLWASYVQLIVDQLDDTQQKVSQEYQSIKAESIAAQRQTEVQLRDMAEEIREKQEETAHIEGELRELQTEQQAVGDGLIRIILECGDVFPEEAARVAAAGRGPSDGPFPQQPRADTDEPGSEAGGVEIIHNVDAL